MLAAVNTSKLNADIGYDAREMLQAAARSVRAQSDLPLRATGRRAGSVRS